MEQKHLFPVSEFCDANPLDQGKSGVSLFEIPSASVFHRDATLIAHDGWNIPRQAVRHISSVAPTAESLPLYYRIETDENVFLLKTVRSYVTEEKLRLASAVMELLSANGLRLAPSLATVRGNFSHPYKGRMFALSKFIDGKHFNGSHEQLLSSAKVIASMHRILKEQEHSIPEAVLNSVKRGKRKLQTASPEELAAAIKQSTITTEFEQKATEMIPELIQFAARITQVLPENPELLILIHADLHAHNLLFQSGSNEPVILDWDNLVWALLNQDVSFSSHRLSRLAGKHTEDAFDIGVDWRTRMTAFLNEYTKILTITDEVREAIPFFLQDEYLTRILLILTYHFIDHRNDADPVLSDYMLLFNEALALEGQRI